MVIGVASESKLVGVHPDLVRVVRYALNEVLPKHKSGIGAVVLEGLRTRERQAALVAKGASKTMSSRHITGHAVDIAATIDGEVRWDWSLYYTIGDVMRIAAMYYDTPLVWGGVWDRRMEELTEFGGMQDDVEAYVARMRSMGKKAFLDGPHFELDRARYP